MKHIIYTLLAVTVGTLVVYRLTRSADSNEKSKRAPNNSITRLNGIVVTPTEFSNSITITGAMEAEQEVQIISQTAGLVTAIYFKEGSFVKKGQTLLMIDDAELKARLSEAVTNQGLAAETEKRAGLLIKSGAISQQEYDVARASLKSMQAQTQLINAQLAKALIKAPFSGRIGLTTVTVGKYLAPTDVVANLVSIDPIKISFSVPEKYSGKIKQGTEIGFKTSGSETNHTATIFAVEPAIERTTRTMQIKARTANTDGSLLPGAFAQVTLPMSTIQDAILIPSEAIVPIQKGQKVFITENGKAKEVKVEGNVRTDKDVLITSGLKAGDTVITSGNMSLKSGTRVKVNISRNK